MKFLGRTVDPLTAPWHVIYRVTNTRTCDCNPLALHDERCPLTPLYTTLAVEYGWDGWAYTPWPIRWILSYGYCNPENPWCKHQCTLDTRDNRIIDPDCFR